MNKKYYHNAIHFNIKGSYACNPFAGSLKAKMTKDKNKITCLNCKKRLG